MTVRSLVSRGVVALLVATSAQAQNAPTARGVATAGAYTAMARGFEALFYNPANLALPDGPAFSLSLPQFSVGATVSGWEVEDFADFADSKSLTDARRAELLAKIPSGGTEGELDVRVPILALQTKGFAAGVSLGLTGRQSLGKDIVDLVVNGYDETRTNYQVGNTKGSSATYIDGAIGYGRAIGPLKLGVTGHYYSGVSLTRSKMFEPRYDANNADVNVDWIGVMSNSGSGFGVDVGAALQPTNSFTLSAVVANAYSNMNWSEDLEYRQLTINKSNIEDADQLVKDFEDSKKPLDPNSVPVAVYQAAQGLYDEAFFPSVLRVGAQWAPTTRTKFGAGYHQNLTDGNLTGWWEKSVSAGVEFALPILALRGGYATSLDDASMVSAGLSLGPIDVGAAKIMNGKFSGANREGWFVTAGIAIRGKNRQPTP
jgi:hypothetical protein